MVRVTNFNHSLIIIVQIIKPNKNLLKKIFSTYIKFDFLNNFIWNFIEEDCLVETMPHDQFDYLKVGQLLLILLISMNENGQHENRFYESILIICHIFFIENKT